MEQRKTPNKATSALSRAEIKGGLCKPGPDTLASLVEMRIREAKDCLVAGGFWKAANKCNAVIDDTLSSGEQRKEAFLVRGKALLALGNFQAAAFDFYRVLEADHSHSEAFGYILQIEADAGLPLTKK